MDRVQLKMPDDLDLDLRLGTRAAGLDVGARHVTLDGGESLPFDGLVIATGLRPRHLDVPDVAGVHYLRTIDDCLAIREAMEKGPRVAVIGAGFIGGEVAGTARERGLEVTLIEALELPLLRVLSRDVAEVIAAIHRDHGVALRLGVGVDGLAGDGRVEGVRLADGEVVPADLVVIGIGVTPATDWLEGSGLELNNGVVCDARCVAKGTDGIVAAGDVARWYNPLFERSMRVEHWTNASEQGEAAAATLVHGPEKAEPFAPVPYFWSDQYDTKIQFIGIAEHADELRVVEGSLAERKFVAVYGKAGRIIGALGFSMPRRLMAYRAQIADRAPLPAPA